MSKKFCIENSVICLPLGENINFEQEEDFYDGIHTRPSGNKKIANYLSNELIEIIGDSLKN